MAKNQSKPSNQPRDPLIPLDLTSNVGLSLGGAGASLLVLLTALQISSTAETKRQQLYEGPVLWSLLALVLWVALWKVGDTHAYWLHKHPEKMRKFPFEKWLLLPFVGALSTLAVAIGNLVQTFATWPLWWASVMLLLSVAVLAWHNRVLKRFADS